MGTSISVVLPNYNHAAKISRALTALLSQSLAPFEIIVVDDCSTDESVEIIKRFQAKSDLVKLIQHSSNRGVPAALNTGLKAAKGELVYFAASDDFTFPDLFAKAANALETHPQAAFFCSHVALINTKGELFGIRPIVPPSLRSDYITAQAVNKCIRASDNWATGPSVIYRHSLLSSMHGFDEELGSFCDGFLVRLLAIRHGFYFSDELLSVWEVNPYSYSSLSAMSPVDSTRQISIASDRVRLTFPHEVRDWYADLLDRRLRFNISRRWVLLPESLSVDSICAIANFRWFDRAVLAVLSKLGVFTRSLSVLWLALRLRPMAASAIVKGAYVAVSRSRRYRREYFSKINTSSELSS